MLNCSKARLAVWGLESYLKKAGKRVSGLPKKIVLFLQDGVAVRKSVRIGGFCALGIGAWLAFAVIVMPVFSSVLMRHELRSYVMSAEHLSQLEELIERPLFSQLEKNEGGFLLMTEGTKIREKMEEQLKSLVLTIHHKKMTLSILKTDGFLIEHKTNWNPKTLNMEPSVSRSQHEKVEELRRRSGALAEELNADLVQQQKLDRMLSFLWERESVLRGDKGPKTSDQGGSWMKAVAIGILWKIAPKDEAYSDCELFYPKTVWTAFSKTVQSNWGMIFFFNPLFGFSCCCMGLSAIILLQMVAKRMTEKIVEEGALQEGKKEALLASQELTRTVSKNAIQKARRVNSL